MVFRKVNKKGKYLVKEKKLIKNVKNFRSFFKNF